jgi:hypothetical protein
VYTGRRRRRNLIGDVLLHVVELREVLHDEVVLFRDLGFVHIG